MIKELTIGYCCNNLRLLVPEIPQLADYPNAIQQYLNVSGFPVKPDGKRKDSSETDMYIRKFSVLYFAMLYSDAYIGRAYMLL